MVLFSYVHFDTYRFKTRSIGHTAITNPRELNKNKEKQRRQKRKYDNLKFKQRQYYQAKQLKFTSAKAKDARFSNQRKLRRMFRNG
tara:strand:- start:1197 stop:1454 length:258 start_codon:yes stop_codon:yes gene_type:complete